MPRKTFDARECANPACTVSFCPDTKQRDKVYCSRACAWQCTTPSHKGFKHSEESRAKISRSKMGQNAGHPFWGNRTAINAARRERAKQQLAARHVLTCARPECENTWKQTAKNAKNQYCSISCAQKLKSTVGERSRGRTPPEGSGRCKWYDFDSAINGRPVRVQGSWELRVAHCLETQGLPWRTNHGRDRFPYVDIDGIERSYCPDFWQDGAYVEVKGYADPATVHKLAQIEAQGVPLRVLYWGDIKALETELFGKPLGGANASLRLIRELAYGPH